MQLTESERASGQLAAETLAFAVDQVRNNGFVIFERIVPEDLLAAMRASFDQLLSSHMEHHDPNRGAHRFQMHLPFEPPWSDERIVANSFVLPVVEALVGEDCICHYLASDTPLPGSDYQETHPDIFSLFPEWPVALPPYSIVLNIPLVDVTERNGPLEIWPGGTHHYVAERSLVPALAAQMHSEPVLVPAGSLLIRDSRMWHRGTPNRSDAARPNFTAIYSRYWLKLRYRPIPIAREAYERLSERAQQLFRQEAIGVAAEALDDMGSQRFYATV
jgi:ectoine hydroxylase-related dioxygenase (phytanoyl-CoA dioxygenase family)